MNEPMKIKFARSDSSRRKDIEEPLRTLIKHIYESCTGNSYEGEFENDIQELSYVLAMEYFEA